MDDSNAKSQVSAVYRALHAAGYPTMATFLAAYPTESYLTVGDHLQPVVSGMQIQKVQMLEVLQDRSLLAVALADALVREICEIYPEGYGGDTLSKNAAVLGRLSGILAGCTNFQVEAKLYEQIARFLQGKPPPNGWKPQSTEDAYVRSIVAELKLT